MAVPEEAGAIYGSTAPNMPAKVILRRSGSEPWQKVENTAPFAPLFFFKGEGEKILAGVADSEGEDIELVRSISLPFFR